MPLVLHFFGFFRPPVCPQLQIAVNADPERPTLRSVRSFCTQCDAFVPYIHATSLRRDACGMWTTST